MAMANCQPPCRGFTVPILSQVCAARCFEVPSRPKPSSVENQILNLHQEGLSISKIAETVFGYKGKHNNGKVQAVLSKFDAV